jgi:hypothetical protein
MSDDTEVTRRQRRVDVQRDEIPGWGVDADPKNDPTYPMRDRSKDDSPGRNWEPPTFQDTDVEILQSIEHVRRPAVFGTSTPPSGLSGVIRRAAFGYSESQWARWLLLMLADRVNAAEGLAQDLGRGRLPHIGRESGMTALWKYDRKAYVGSVVSSLAVAGAAAGIGYLLLRNGRRRS